MDGVLVIDKPSGWTSHDVVAKCRKALNIKRMGHTGTLDPFATGVLVLLVGKATRLARFFGKDEKEYIAKLRFGFETDTGDRTGRPLSEEVKVDICEEKLISILRNFVGETEQIPPMFSAKKVNGKKLYELARKGIEIKREPIKVNISKLELIELKAPFAIIHVVCSAGTYIRVLAEDIGKKLGCGAHLTELRRTRVGRFDLSKALSIDKLEEIFQSGGLNLTSMKEALSFYPERRLSKDEVSLIKKGRAIEKVGSEEFREGEFIRLSDQENLVAVGVFQNNKIQPRVVLV